MLYLQCLIQQHSSFYKKKLLLSELLLNIQFLFICSFVYSQAYIRPKSTAVQIARIAAVTLVTMTVVLGSFILAASWVQARASCTPESIAAIQAEMRLQQQQQQQPSSITYQQGEFLKHLQPEALIQVSLWNILTKGKHTQKNSVKCSTLYFKVLSLQLVNFKLQRPQCYADN